MPFASVRKRTKSSFSRQSGQLSFFSAMICFRSLTRSLEKSVMLSAGGSVVEAKRRLQISAELFFSRSQIFSDGRPFLIGCDSSRLIGAM